MFLVKFIGLVSPACVLLEPPKFRSDTMTFVKTLCSPKPSAASAGPDPRQACPWGTSRRCRRSRTRSPGWACPAPSPHPGQHASCSSLSRPPTSLPKLGPLCSAPPPVCRDMPRFLAEWHTRRFKRRRRFFLFVDRQEPPHPILRTHLNTSRGAEGWNPTPSPSEIGIGDRRWGGGGRDGAARGGAHPALLRDFPSRPPPVRGRSPARRIC